jgi:hypothetical protein
MLRHGTVVMTRCLQGIQGRQPLSHQVYMMAGVRRITVPTFGIIFNNHAAVLVAAYCPSQEAKKLPHSGSSVTDALLRISNFHRVTQ